MNRCFRWTTTLLALAAIVGFGRIAAAADESALIETLQSNKSPQEKDEACQQLKHIGTAKSVPALAKLLADDQLSHSARYALETIPGAEAAAALRDALANAKGLTKAGIIDTIGARRDPKAVGALKALLADADPAVASSAAGALGRIAGPESAAALKSALPTASRDLQPIIADSLMLCADEFLASGNAKAANDLYAAMYSSDLPERIKTAAFRGMVLSAGDSAAALAAKGLAGSDQPALLASLQLVREIKGTAATEQFASALAKLQTQPEIAVALIDALAQRGDSAALSAIRSSSDSALAPIRIASLKALGVLGDDSTAIFLASRSAAATGPEQDAARQALVALHHPKVCEALIAQLPSAKPDVQAEIVRALGQRQETNAVPALLKLAQADDESTRLMALKSLASLANPTHVNDLILLLISAKSDSLRSAAERALIAAGSRADRPEASAPPVVAALKSATDIPTKASLLRVAGRFGGPESAAALREALASSDATLQDAALRTIAEYSGIGAAPTLLGIANDEDRSTSQRVLALRGYWRLVGAAADRSLEIRWRMCEAGLKAAQRPEEKRLGLAELGKVPHPSALKLAQSLCDQPDIRDEAETAVVRIAAALAGSNPAEAKAALLSIQKTTRSDTLRADTRRALDAMEQYVGYITTWSVAGPYRQAGKQCAELFDIAFAPEQAGAKVNWKRLAPAADASLFWQADLLPTAGGDSCVVYVKSRVFCPSQRQVRLDIGSDDGNKIWLNGKLVHAKNVQRPIAASQDTAQATLKAGWNDFLIKVTQNNMGCAVCVRIRGMDGSVIDGLRFDAGE